MKSQDGFTLVELLTALVIIMLLTNITFVFVLQFNERSRDTNRISGMKEMEIAFEEFFLDKGYYPPACGFGKEDFGYQYRDSNGVCNGIDVPSADMNAENSAPGGLEFVDVLDNPLLYPDYFGTELWKDPFGHTQTRSRYNCRYIVPRNDKGCWIPSTTTPSEAQYDTCLTNCKPTNYFLHCSTETNPDIATSDGGGDDTVIELGATPWICISSVPDPQG